MNERVSIILPVYNGQAYLAQAIQSCLETTCDELVLVDDGSTDSTRLICRFYTDKDPRVSYYYKENGGPASALNHGMSHANGSIFMFAASDDVQLPDKVETGLEAIVGADIGYSGYYHCNTKAEPWEYVPPRSLTVANIKKNIATSGEALVIRKEVFEKTPFREHMRYNEDQAFLVDCYKAGYRYGMVDKPSFKYRLLKTGISYARKAEVDKSVEELNKELDDCRRDLPKG
jgi:glycosyltransferase involved in cell wall biosynthesis